jgi:hypothetical protein
MTIPRLMSIRRLLISLLDIIEQELIERGALQQGRARTINARDSRQA